MSIHGLLQEPASYPKDFITLPFTIPPTSGNYGQQTYTSITRTLDALGNVPSMAANDDFDQTEFDLGINVYLSQITVTLHLDDTINYNNIGAFGMIGWDYGSDVTKIIVFTYNAGVADVTNWGIDVVAFPIIQGGLWSEARADSQLTGKSLFLATPALPSPPPLKWSFNAPPGLSFNENPIVIGATGILYIAEDGGNLLAVTDNGNSASILWNQASGYSVLTAPVLGRNNTLYIGGSNIVRGVSEIDTATPSIMWTCNVTPLVAPFPPVISYDENGEATIFISGTNGHVYAVGQDGSYKWVYVQGNVTIYIALSQDGSILYATTGSTLYAVNAATGVVKWSRVIASPLSAPTVGRMGSGAVYVYSGTNVYRVTDNGLSSSLSWTLNTTTIPTRTISIGYNGRLYLVTSNQVLAITDNGNSGTLSWLYAVNPALAPNALQPPAISVDGTLYISGDYMLALSITDGGPGPILNWGLQYSGGLSCPITIGVNRRCYFGGDQQQVIRCF